MRLLLPFRVRFLVSPAVVVWMAAASLHGADVVSDFSADNEGWIVIDHTFVGTNGAPSNTGLVASDTNPPTLGGRLRVWDLSSQWCWNVAPDKFHGDWRVRRTARADVTASTLTIKYPVLFWIGDGRDTNCLNSAYYLFPLTNTIGGQTATYSASLSSTNWVVTRGSWTNLLSNVREFWIRTDLTDGCGNCSTQETNWLDNVVLEQRWLGALGITVLGGMALLDWTAGTGVGLQTCGDLEAPSWTLVPGTIGSSHYEEPASNSAAFYRLFQ